jgi:molybdopterin synthase sulfur carrier subunit
MKILYFALIREKIGLAEEDAAPPASVATAGDLIAWLKTRGDNYVRALADPRAVRVAVNQEHVRLDHPVKNGDEVALFPPVTGG